MTLEEIKQAILCTIE
jgi:hypothetical protein